MRIGLTGRGSSVNQVLDQAQRAERDGFTSLWYASVVTGDPLVAMATAGRATSQIELGTAVPPDLLVPSAPPGTTGGIRRRRHGSLGFHARYRPIASIADRGRIRAVLCAPRPEYRRVCAHSHRRPGRKGGRLRRRGLDGACARIGRRTQACSPGTCVRVGVTTAPASRPGGRRHGLVDGDRARHREPCRPEDPRRGRGGGTSRSEDRGGPTCRCAQRRGQSLCRCCGTLYCLRRNGNYQRILSVGGVASPAEAAIVGTESVVRAELQSLLDAGATDIWAAVFPVGEDKVQSVQRTTDLLRELAA